MLNLTVIQFNNSSVQVSIREDQTFSLTNCKISRFSSTTPMVLVTLPGVPHYEQHISAHLYKGKFFIDVIENSTFVGNFECLLSKEEKQAFKDFCNNLPEYDWK